MICPKCKTQNSDDSIFCSNCGFKLKIVCPKCRMTNALNASKCSSCGLRLIRFCPVCQAANNPLSEKCKKCSTPLLKKCKSCGALNTLSAKNCKKCAAALDEKSEIYIQHSVLLIELTNGSFLSENISQKELSEKLIKKFFQTILSALKPHDLKALKLGAYMIGVELDSIDDAKMLKISEEILQEFKVLNDKLANSGISYDIKLFVSQASSPKHKFGVQMLPKVPIGLISTDSPSAMSLEKIYRLQKIFPGLYIVIERLQSRKHIEIEPELSREEIPQVADNVEDIEKYAQNVQMEEFVEEIPGSVEQIVEEPPIIEPDSVKQEESPAEIKQEQEESPKVSMRMMTLNNLTNLLRTKQSGFVALLGDYGVGKKTFLNLAFSELRDKNFCLLQADCHSTLLNVPFATLQNLIRSMFSLPLINYEAEKIKETVRNALANSLGIVEEEVIFSIVNLIVPQAEPDVDIEKSKQKLIFAVKTLFKAIQKLQKVVLIIKEIEFLDKASAEVFDAMIEDDFLQDAFLITTTSSNSHISAFIQSEKIQDNAIGTFKIMPFEESEIRNELAYYIKNVEEIPEEFLSQLKTKVNGWPLFFEEIIMFLTQSGFLYNTDEGVKIKTDIKELILPNNVEEIIAVRLDAMFSQNEVVYQVVANAVCLGYTFFPPIIQRVLGLDNENFAIIMQSLMTNGFLMTHDNVNFKFKNKFVYDVIKNIVIKDEMQESQINANLLNVLVEINESNSSQAATIAKKAGNLQVAFRLWSKAAEEAASVGDKALYLYAQKEALENIEYSDYEDKEGQKLQIQEDLGVTNYISSPEEAIIFLSAAINSYENQKNGFKVIELSSYIVKSLSLIGSSQEALEYIDKALEYVDVDKFPLESAVLKFLKLELLIESGFLGEVITTIQSEIIPNLQEGVKTQDDFTDFEYEVIEEAVLTSQILLIKALALQGNKNYYNVLELFINNNQNEEAQIRVFVIDAMHKTLNGEPDASEVSLQKTIKIINNTNISDKNNILLEIELIRLCNKAFYLEHQNLGMEISDIAQKARKLNNSFVYNCIQLLFVKQLLDNCDYLNATNMVNDCLGFFASQKIAMFAMPSWMILSMIQSQIGDFEQAISISQQALDVASKPQIQNNYFVAYIKKLLSDYFMLQGDFEMAKMHLEQAIEFAKENELVFIQGKLYIELANLHYKMLETVENKEQYVETIKKLLVVAHEKAMSIESKYLINKIASIQSKLN